jgi:hypothetical protein
MVSPVIPNNKGSGQVALADTRSAWVNLRTGPGTSYTDIGDVRDNTLVQYYPTTRQGDWVYLEQYGLAGWVHTGFVAFEAVTAAPPTAPNVPTPYDQQVGIWYWEGDSVQERTIEEVVANIKRLAPQITQFYLKTSNGPLWQGASDSKTALAVNGPDDITRWGEVVERYGMELHAWCVPRGNTNISEEIRVMTETVEHPMVKSLILDVEPDRQWYWAGTEAQVREMMVGLKRNIPGSTHIGMAVDPRPWHYETIFPDAWRPFVDSILPMVYWVTFRATPDAALRQMYDAWLPYGLPIVPILQADAPTSEIREAHSLATVKYGAKSVSWWRYGVASSVEMNALSISIPDENGQVTTPPTNSAPPGNGGTDFVDEILITPSDSQFARGTYTGQEEFRSYVQRMGWTVYHTRTSRSSSKVWAMWTPKVEVSGEYAVDVFVHKPFSTTRNARYKIHGVRGQNNEVTVSVNQNQNVNDWYRLGVFDFDKDLPNSGRVFLNDLTGEDGRNITFDAVRYRRVVMVDPTPEDPPGATTDGTIVKNGVTYCDGFDSPVGNQRNSGDRTGSRIWPVGWRDASPYAEPYLYSSYLGRYTSVHTGADLNWGSGAYADVGQEIYSIASGVVIFANERREWGNLVVIQHDPYIVDGRRVATRYAHLNRVDVSVGDRVARGELIGTLGGTRGRPGLSWVPHLHFDVMPATTMERNVEDWPPARYKNGLAVSQMTNVQYQAWIAAVRNDILKDYYNPEGFIESNRPSR